MKQLLHVPLAICFLLSGITFSSTADRTIELNFGIAPSKGVLAVGYRNGMNQINAGLNGLAWSSRPEWLIVPMVSYNRYLTLSGFYALLSYEAVYADLEQTSFRMSGDEFVIERDRVKGWHPGAIRTGLGKSFQFTRWGLHLDAGLATPATSDIGRLWGAWIGAGASYRFRID